MLTVAYAVKPLLLDPQGHQCLYAGPTKCTTKANHQFHSNAHGMTGLSVHRKSRHRVTFKVDFGIFDPKRGH